MILVHMLLATETAEWFFQQRGLTRGTLEHFEVRTDPGPKTNIPWYSPGDVVLSYSNGEKVRRNPLKQYDNDREPPRFSFTKGVQPGLFNIADAAKPTIFLLEGETDTMRLWQELHNEDNPNPAGVVGLSGINTWRKELAEQLADVKTVFVVLDNDDYMIQPQLDAAWREIRADLGSKAKRLYLPEGVKDVCEFFDVYDMETLRLIAKKAGSGKSRYLPLNLRQDPPPADWLIDSLIAMGDVTLVPGPPGVGKSWLTMGVTVAVAEGWPSLLSCDVGHRGRVLYVDQENPLDVVIRRLKLLGLSEAGMDNIRYLWNCGIRLDKEPGKFIDEAIEFEPKLIVLDSLTRLHTQDENNAGAMAALVNDSIQPLARATGAAVMLIHHDNKAGEPRGSIDIMASVDAALQARSAGEANPGTFHLKQIKSRRMLSGSAIDVTIQDDEVADRVYLRADQPLNPPF
jgi:hypothetical protein